MDDGGWKQVKLVDNGLGKPSSYVQRDSLCKKNHKMVTLTPFMKSLSVFAEKIAT